jgi:glycopeptide antibiotics resistance protein
MRKLLFAISALIVYGSIYPFNFNLDAYDSGMLPGLFYFGLGRTGGGDLISNVVLFLPFGFLAMQCTRNRWSWKSWLLILGLGFSFAYAIQVAQLIIPKRVPSGSDAVWNVVGCALGCLLGMTRMPRIPGTPNIPAGPLPVPTLLAVFLILWNLRPFVPSLDVQNITDNLKHLLSSPIPQPLWTFQNLVAWLLVFHFFEAEDVKPISEKHYPMLVLLTLGLGLFIVGNSITIDRIAGALLALPAWKVLRGLPRTPILCLSTFIVIVGIGFTPFELRAEPIAFKWIPFQGALGGNMFINVLATTKKMLLYGCLIYLLVELNLRLMTSTLIVSVFLFVSEFLQIFFHKKTPEITDSILALMIGIGFYIWDDHRRKSGGIEVHPASSLEITSIGVGRS